MYDIINLRTLDHFSEWVQIIRKNTEDIPIFLIGNKIDLEESREVSREEGIEFAKKYNLLGFNEVSCKTGQNVEELFERVIKIIVDYWEDSHQNQD